MKPEAVIYVVDDDEPIRKSLHLLMKSAGYTSRCCASAHEFLECHDASRPGCLVLDVRMPGMSGLELQEMLRETGIAIPVIIMTGHGDIPMAVRAMKAGALDFIEKPFDNQLLLNRIAQALEEAADERERWQAAMEAAELLDRLTPRERETMDLLVEGKLNKQIAADLGISVRTVEAHRAKIMEKLDARSLSDLVRLSMHVS
ncbi:MAG: response regulator transcription factor [Gammaproteobacteria bacterium]|nr:response regulator transcription factor [Gammaproteobacteria bacterium]NIR97883.1 response regulator transcription factor [Gammaproteobacteria bacterium]NIT63588.1 response regulator transcription factor [Gammaproteobacteria bacterium]NIV20524.1 response regulator [Gammaproteobacteria bacterium]NIX11118.1 response regulator [Gammaproteobacteria bacterium]